MFDELKYHHEYKSIASAQYESIKKELKGISHDFYGTRYAPECDPMIQGCIAQARQEEVERKQSKCPSAIRDRFTCKYWRNWDKELDILQGFSKDDERNARNKKQLKLKKPTKPSKKKVGDSNVISYSFAGPISTAPTHFDKHLLRDNHVDVLISECLQQQKPDEKILTLNHHLHDSIGVKKVKGGAFPTSKTHQEQKSVTQLCDIPPVEPIRSQSNIGRFSMLPRFENPKPNFGSTGSDSNICESMSHRIPGGSFSTSKRALGGLEGHQDTIPGPGSYPINRLFDDQTRDLTRALQDMEAHPCLVHASSIEMADLVGFGYGCNRQQHILYGMCLDGKCGLRSKWEQVMVATEDLPRFCGPTLAQTYKDAKANTLREKSHSRSTGEKEEQLALTQAYLDCIPPPIQSMSPVYRAIYKGDLKALEQLRKTWQSSHSWTATQTPSELFSQEINRIEKATGFAPLHVAVIQNHVNVVEWMMEYVEFLDLYVQDAQGNTALHWACRRNELPIVELLCDMGVDPLKLVNNKHETCLDCSWAPEVAQRIRIQIEQLGLKKELSSLRRDVRRKHTLNSSESFDQYQDSKYFHSMATKTKDGKISSPMITRSFMKESYQEVLPSPYISGQERLQSIVPSISGPLQALTHQSGLPPTIKNSYNNSSSFPPKDLELSLENDGGTMINTTSSALSSMDSNYSTAMDSTITIGTLGLTRNPGLTKTLLKNSHYNSYVIGYWKEDAEKTTNNSSGT